MTSSTAVGYAEEVKCIAPQAGGCFAPGSVVERVRPSLRSPPRARARAQEREHSVARVHRASPEVRFHRRHCAHNKNPWRLADTEPKTPLHCCLKPLPPKLPSSSTPWRRPSTAEVAAGCARQCATRPFSARCRQGPCGSVRRCGIRGPDGPRRPQTGALLTVRRAGVRRERRVRPAARLLGARPARQGCSAPVPHVRCAFAVAHAPAFCST